MNAALRAVVRSAAYNKIEVYGIESGYEGMIAGKMHKLEIRDVGNIMQRGGTFLKTARSMEFMTEKGREKAFKSLQKFKIEGCVALGGNGTFTGAKIFHEEHKVPIIGVPCTIDNDLYGTDNTIGFDTAVNTAVEAVDKIRDTAESHERLFFVEVMGRHSGFIAVHTAIASGAGTVIVPERPMSEAALVEKMQALAKRRKRFSLIIVAEGSPLGSAAEIAEKVKPQLSNFDIRVTVIGHLQRGGAPSGYDRLLASRLGDASVEALFDGFSDVMVGLVNNQIKHTPLSIAIKNEKPIDLDIMRLAEKLAI